MKEQCLMPEPQTSVGQPQLLQLGLEWGKQEPTAASGIKAIRGGTGVHESHVGTLWGSPGQRCHPTCPSC